MRRALIGIAAVAALLATAVAVGGSDRRQLRERRQGLLRLREPGASAELLHSHGGQRVERLRQSRRRPRRRRLRVVALSLLELRRIRRRRGWGRPDRAKGEAGLSPGRYGSGRGHSQGGSEERRGVGRPPDRHRHARDRPPKHPGAVRRPAGLDEHARARRRPPRDIGQRSDPGPGRSATGACWTTCSAGSENLGKVQLRRGWAEVYVYQHNPFEKVRTVQTRRASGRERGPRRLEGLRRELPYTAVASAG